MQTFGELAMLSGEPRMATVTALTDCRFLLLEAPLLLELLHAAPAVAILDMFAVLSRQIRAANEGDFRKLLASRTLESQMEVEKQRGLTQMVAGVAHEINTPLGVAGTAASIVARELAKLAPLAVDRKSQSALEDIHEALDLLQRNLERAHKLVQDFKKLSVSQLGDEKEPMDLPQAIRDTLNLAQMSFKRSQIAVTFNNQLPPGAQTWVGYRGYLSQILLNLLSNVERYAYPAGQGGAGLGMTIVYNLVTTALKGRITVRSVVGQGTDARIVFPRVIPD